MHTDIILSGVGGQGILSIATVIGSAAIKEGLYIKQAEVHGMSQRGGDVQSNLRISSDPIASDLIPLGKADIIISLEPMEALRYLPYLNKNGWLITNTVPFVNITNCHCQTSGIAPCGKHRTFGCSIPFPWNRRGQNRRRHTQHLRAQGRSHRRDEPQGIPCRIGICPSIY